MSLTNSKRCFRAERELISFFLREMDGDVSNVTLSQVVVHLVKQVKALERRTRILESENGQIRSELDAMRKAIENGEEKRATLEQIVKESVEAVETRLESIEEKVVPKVARKEEASEMGEEMGETVEELHMEEDAAYNGFDIWEPAFGY